jgi:hypothetical protein
MSKPFLSFLILTLFFSLNCYSQQSVSPEVTQTVINNGIGLGSVIAVVISWERNKSVLFTIIHGLFGWLYVIYFLAARQVDERR